jgi:methyl-accepting chemotaxis protein
MKNWNMQVKLIFILLLVGVIPVATITLISLFNVSSQLVQSSMDQLDAVRTIKQNQITSYFDERRGDLLLASENPATRGFMGELLTLYQASGQSGQQVFRPDSLEDRGRAYQELYARTNEALSDYEEYYGYYDVFLMDPRDGYVLYAMAQEKDYLSSLSRGDYKDSPLAEVWRKVVRDQQVHITDMEPYTPSNGEPAMFIGAPVKEGDILLGVLVMQVDPDSINAIMTESTGMGSTGETYLVGPDFLMRSDSRLEPTTHSILASFANPSTGSVRTEAVLEAQKGQSDTKLITDYLGSPVYSSWGSIPLDGFSLTILAEINQEEIMGPIWSLVLWTSLIVLIFVAGILLVAVLFARSIARPLARVTKAAGSIARGVLDVELKINQGDEIGQMAGAMQGMIRSLKEKGEVIASMAAGDLSQDIPLASDEDELGKNMRLMSRSLNEILSSVDQAVIQMASGADQVATASQDLSQGATEQASSLEEISASANEVGGQAEQNSNSSAQATSLAKKNTQDAREGNQLMSELLEIMAQITQSADETKKIVKTIDDIAFQVNLLALNANVEAARAGKYGRGFAVVAEEVRTLAVRSAQAVKETTQMVEESQTRVLQGNEKAQVTGKQLARPWWRSPPWSPTSWMRSPRPPKSRPWPSPRSIRAWSKSTRSPNPTPPAPRSPPPPARSWPPRPSSSRPCSGVSPSDRPRCRPYLVLLLKIRGRSQSPLERSRTGRASSLRVSKKALLPLGSQNLPIRSNWMGTLRTFRAW